MRAWCHERGVSGQVGSTDSEDSGEGAHGHAKEQQGVEKGRQL